MPRRNQRVEINTSLPPSLDDLRQQRKRTVEREQVHRPNKWEAERRREDNRIRPILFCIWPDCDKPSLRFQYPVRPVPLCFTHAARVNSSFTADPQMSLVASLDADAEESRRKFLGERSAIQSKLDAESRQHAPGWIYYLDFERRIKIGFTTDLERRLREYAPTADLVGLHPGTRAMETELHRRFRIDLLDGREWYAPSDRIRDHIADVVKQFGKPKQPAKATTGQRRQPTTYPRGWSGGRSA